MKRLVSAGIGLALALLALAPAALAAPASATGFTGGWTTTDCVVWWQEPHDPAEDCGDGSQMYLGIGPGDTPRMTFQDAYASSCDNAGSPSTRFVGAGRGEYFLVEGDLHVGVALHKTGCGHVNQGLDVWLQFYWDSGSDTLWEDEDGDGYGYIWQRVP